MKKCCSNCDYWSEHPEGGYKCYKHSYWCSNSESANYGDSCNDWIPKEDEEINGDYRVAVNDILDYLKDIHFNEYMSSITSGVGVIRFNAEEFINDLKKHFKNT